MTDPASQPSEIDEIATRYWEDVLRLSPLTATVYGDDRYDDRLDDPGPDGRAAERQLLERVWREAAAVSPDGLPDEDRITRDMLQVVAEIAIEADDLAYREMLRRGPDPRPADAPAAADPVPAGRHARAARRVPRPGSAATGRTWTPTSTSSHDGLRSGRTAARIVAERTIEPARAHPRDRRSRRRSSRRWPRWPATRNASGSATSCARSSTPPTGGCSRRSGARTTRPPASSPASSRRPTGRRSTGTGSGAGPRSTSSPRTSTRSGSRSSPRSTTSGARSRAAEGFGDDLHAYRRQLGADPANQAPTPEELVARAMEDIGRAAEVAPRVFGRLPRAACEVRPVEAFKEKDAPFAYYFPPTIDGSRPGIYYVNTYDLPSRTYSKLASTTFHEAIPGHHFQISLEMEHPGLNVFRRLGRPVRGRRLRRGLGPVRRAPRRRARPVPDGGRAVRDARRAGLARVAADRRLRDARAGLVAPAVDRLAARHGPVRDRRHRSRPTATSCGRARRSPT